MTARATAAAVLDRFVAQHQRPAETSELDVARLAPHVRCLLVTDGTVTSQLQAWAMEPTRTECLHQESRSPTPFERRWLDAGPDMTGLVRRVSVRGASTGRLFLSAWSVLLPERLPAAFVDSLHAEDASIGTSLARGLVEHRRELLWCARGRDGTPQRTYRIHVQGAPALLIGENFRC